MANNVSIAKAKKGDTVMLCMFTGCKTGPKEVVACDKSTITIKMWHGEVTFDRKTGKQIEPMPKNARYASFITVDDGTFVHPTHKKKKSESEKKMTKTKKAKSNPKSADDKNEAEETEEIPTPKKVKKSPTKKVKKSEPAPEPEEEEWDDDEDDDWDDDDFEEVE